MDDLNNPAKWQAGSHPDLAERKPDELFEPEFAERYGRMHNDLLQRITRLHGTIRTLETLEDFPFESLYYPNHMVFWCLVFDNFLDTCCLILHGLVEDKGKDVHNIPSFRDTIVQGPWLDQSLKKVLKETLRNRKPDRDAESVAKRVGEIRKHWIAHRLIDKQTGYPKERLAGVSLEELRELFDAAHSLFGALSFGSPYATLEGDEMPSTIGGEPTPTCLDKVLDAVLRDSHFVNRPEREREGWPMYRERMSPEALKTMNKLRKRVGLAEA